MSPAKLRFERFGVSYGGNVALRELTLSIASNTIHAIIGPARSGKTSLLRSINRLASDVDQALLSGSLQLDGEDLLALDRTALRRRVGMVFATPQPLPGSIYDNLAFGPRRSGLKSRRDLDARVESGLKSADLWEEVKDRLRQPASALSGGQQQRLCIARSLALSPEVILLDEPCSGLDPISTFKIEQTLRALKSQLTCVLVTNNTKQAARVSDRTAFMLSGELIEDAPTSALFTTPQDRRTADYVEGRFG
ncbi:MAG TPA: phosphate ABC transporter ATP-binding protein [Polyangiaceae bacterium]|nr:phosphate ABC transporter ATP-binding protein [Polyangiaceae bacterium]